MAFSIYFRESACGRLLIFFFQMFFFYLYIFFCFRLRSEETYSVRVLLQGVSRLFMFPLHFVLERPRGGGEHDWGGGTMGGQGVFLYGEGRNELEGRNKDTEWLVLFVPPLSLVVVAAVDGVVEGKGAAKEGREERRRERR